MHHVHRVRVMRHHVSLRVNVVGLNRARMMSLIKSLRHIILLGRGCEHLVVMVHGHRSLVICVLVWHRRGMVLIVNGLGVSMVSHGVVRAVHGGVLGVAASSMGVGGRACMLRRVRGHMVRFRLSTLDLLIGELAAHLI